MENIKKKVYIHDLFAGKYNLQQQYKFSHSFGIISITDLQYSKKIISSKKILSQFENMNCEKNYSEQFKKLKVLCTSGFYPQPQLMLDTYIQDSVSLKLYKCIFYNKQLYDVCIDKMIKFGYLYKLFYFNLIDCEDDNFIDLFKKFIPMFLSNQYDKCLTYYHNCFHNGFWFMQRYIDEYKYITKDYNGKMISDFQNKYFDLIKNIHFLKINLRENENNFFKHL